MMFDRFYKSSFFWNFSYCVFEMFDIEIMAANND